MEVYYNLDGHTLNVRLVGELDEHSAELVRRRHKSACLSYNIFFPLSTNLSTIFTKIFKKFLCDFKGTPPVAIDTKQLRHVNAKAP